MGVQLDCGLGNVSYVAALTSARKAGDIIRYKVRATLNPDRRDLYHAEPSMPLGVGGTNTS